MARAARGKRKAGKPKSGLTVGSVTGPPAHRMSVRRAAEIQRITERRVQAWELHAIYKLTFDQIGARLGVSGKTAHGDVQFMARALVEQSFVDVEQRRLAQQALLDRMVQANIGKATNPKAPDHRAAATVLAALEREARLNGLDIRRIDGYTPDQLMRVVGGLVTAFLELVPEDGALPSGRELRQRYAERVQRLIGDLSDKVIDVTPRKGGA